MGLDVCFYEIWASGSRVIVAFLLFGYCWVLGLAGVVAVRFFCAMWASEGEVLWAVLFVG